jgi:hypothetical protein
LQSRPLEYAISVCDAVKRELSELESGVRLRWTANLQVPRTGPQLLGTGGFLLREAGFREHLRVTGLVELLRAARFVAERPLRSASDHARSDSARPTPFVPPGGGQPMEQTPWP